MRYGNNYFSAALLRLLPGSDLEDIWHEEKLTLDERNNEHFVYETPTFARKDIVECQRLNIFAHRIFSAIDNKDHHKVRDRYFSVKDAKSIDHIRMLSELITFFASQINNQNHPIYDPNLLFSEGCNRLIFRDISNQDISICT